MEAIKSITIINDRKAAVHLRITWPEGDEGFVLPHGAEARPELLGILENTEIKIEAGPISAACIYKSSADDKTARLTSEGWMEWL